MRTEIVTCPECGHEHVCPIVVDAWDGIDCEWTWLHSLWSAVLFGADYQWCVRRHLIPAPNLSGTDLSGTDLSGAVGYVP